MAPPEPPSPMVRSGTPTVSMKCSLIIIAVSADSVALQAVWKVLSVDVVTA